LDELLPLSYFVNHPSHFGNGGEASGNTFAHGAFHGVFIAILVAMPIIANKALFEQRGFKYFLLNFGYWAVTLGLMGGILDAALPTVGTYTVYLVFDCSSRLNER